MFIQGTAGRLRVDDYGGTATGRGVPVVFVHGLAASHKVWKAQLSHLRRLRRRAVAFDLRGMGESDPARDGDYSVDAMVRDLAALTDALGLRRYHLVGHSFAGAVVSAAAAAFPDRVAGLVLVDPSGDNRNQSAEEIAGLRAGMAPHSYPSFTRGWYEAILDGASDATRKAVLTALAATPQGVFAAVVEAMLTFDPFAPLAAYKGPRLAIVAERFVGPRSLHVAAGLPAKTMSGVSHWLMMDRPDELNRLLDEFLESGGLAR